MGRNRRPLQLVPQISLLIFICCIKLLSDLPRKEAAEIRCMESERRALLQFKQGLVDDHDILASWRNSTSNSTAVQDCCQWRGVRCSKSTGNVIMLALRGHWSNDLDRAIGLSGEISSSLLELHHLRYLDLSINSFTQIPKFIGSLKELRTLNLSSIDFNVTKVPYQLGNLSNLQSLDLSGSSIIMKNTEWLSRLSALQYLNLNYVDLSEFINVLPNVVTQLPFLVELHLANTLVPKTPVNIFLPRTNFSKTLAVLDISENYLPSSWIYPWLFNFSGSLTDIDLSYNQLLDTIPEAFGTCKLLQNLDLTTNGLEGGIPSSFGNLSNLVSLHLAGNNLKDDLPRFFQNLSGSTEKSIQVLDLSGNQLSGSLPDFTPFSALRELDLEDNQLNGSFPEQFEKISRLFVLDLADNQISGSLPNLSAFPLLEELYFESNRVQGTLAEKIVSLSELKYLGVSTNFLQGTISETHLTNLSHLIYLDLAYNSLALEIDSDWSPPFQLDVISLASCKLGPSFPTWLQTQKNFSVLDISSAGINDSVPFWFWDQLTPSLIYLNLSSNQIHGTVPDLMFEDQPFTHLMFGDLPFIDLSSNSFSGKVPLFPSNTQSLFLDHNMFSGSISVLCNLTTLDSLDLSNNQLSGELPDCWMNFGILLILNLENNNFSGRIPASMGSLELIDMMSMRRNSLTGELPSSLKNCSSLRLLDLGENKLHGNIPKWIGQSLSDLVVLSLPFNGLTGTLPSSLCSLAKLQILDVSVNSISGRIPYCLNNFTGMTVRQSQNATSGFGENSVGLVRTRLSRRSIYVFTALLQWKGRLSEYGDTLPLVLSLDLSSNRFSGEIPGQITSLSGLLALNLSRNNLTGLIPQNIGLLRWLDFLDLSRNHLSGRIPASFSQLSNLGVLDLSSNNLSGRIPLATQLQSFNASSYMGNPALCGLPLPNGCPGDVAPQGPGISGGTDDVADEGSDDQLITRGFYVSLAIGVAFGFWGVCGTLVIKDSWRYSYFEFLNHVKDWFYVTIAVNFARLKRQFRP